MPRSKKHKTEEQKAKFFRNTIRKTGKWRGSKVDEYIKYIKRKKEQIEDFKFHPYFGFMLKNPKKYGKKWLERRNANIENKKGGEQALKLMKKKNEEFNKPRITK